MLVDEIKLSVIVLFYQGERWVDACMGSLEKQSLSRDIYEIILEPNRHMARVDVGAVPISFSIPVRYIHVEWVT